ncbi:DUF6634 family protein [Methylobacterium sp. E-066]|uniref:DUF6634 family protein n=1 Tax=Methylobacterium sp. E-066 TaxID=2836584 RepID=UPI001FBBFB76|nr:DUF6634 family protein [Methylobacterium sp. E-066]MCJ2138424.1 hypothetical protein [Methylobacterium sp. E-066]
MSVLNQGPGPFPHLAETARQYRAIADDLDRIARGRHPGEGELRVAPRLWQWRVIAYPVHHLVGIVLRHPLLRDGQIRTSELLTYDPERGYARTRSRFYRLESPSLDGS